MKHVWSSFHVCHRTRFIPSQPITFSSHTVFPFPLSSSVDYHCAYLQNLCHRGDSFWVPSHTWHSLHSLTLLNVILAGAANTDNNTVASACIKLCLHGKWAFSLGRLPQALTACGEILKMILLLLWVRVCGYSDEFKFLFRWPSCWSAFIHTHVHNL